MAPRALWATSLAVEGESWWVDEGGGWRRGAGVGSPDCLFNCGHGARALAWQLDLVGLPRGCCIIDSPVQWPPPANVSPFFAEEQQHAGLRAHEPVCAVVRCGAGGVRGDHRAAQGLRHAGGWWGPNRLCQVDKGWDKMQGCCRHIPCMEAWLACADCASVRATCHALPRCTLHPFSPKNNNPCRCPTWWELRSCASTSSLASSTPWAQPLPPQMGRRQCTRGSEWRPTGRARCCVVLAFACLY